MKVRIKYNFLFPAIGGRFDHDWIIEAEYSREQVPDFDLEGDRANTDSVFESIAIWSVTDQTHPYNVGPIVLQDIDAEIRRSIVSAGIRAGSIYYNELLNEAKREQRERNRIALGHAV